MEQEDSVSDTHAYSRYACVSPGAIEKLQQDYMAGRDLGRTIPEMDETTATVIVAESMQAQTETGNRIEPGLLSSLRIDKSAFS